MASSILIVEANQERADRLKRAFDKEGYQVLITGDGQEAWDLCRRQLPQAVLLDINLPDIDGYELLRRIRGALRTRHIHVTFLTDQKERRDKIASLEMGADDYIFKPYDVEEVHLRVRNVLRRASAGNLVDPVTGLPGSRLIQEQLRELLRRQDDWALLRVVVRHLDELADSHGFLVGQEALRTMAQSLSEAVDEDGGSEDFIGHGSGDEFIVITLAEAGKKLSDTLVQRLQEAGRTHYSPQECEQGFVTIRQADGSEREAPLLSVSVRMVTAAQGPFYDLMQLTGALD